MALTTYPSTPKPAYSYILEHQFKTFATDFSEGTEARSRRWRFPKRTFNLVYKIMEFTSTKRDPIYEFFQNRLGIYEPFWYFDRQSRKWLDQKLGIGDAVEDTFDLPGNGTVAAVYVDGVSQGVNGTEQVTNGGMETGDPPTGWSAYNSGTISQTAAQAHAGTKSGQFTFNAAGAWGGFTQNYIGTIGKTYRVSAWVRGNNLAAGTFYLEFDGANIATAAVSNGAWVHLTADRTYVGGGGNIGIYVYGTDIANANKIFYVDDASIIEWGDYQVSSGTGEGGVEQIIFNSAPADDSLLTADFTGYLRIKGRFKDDRLIEEIVTKHFANFTVSILEVKNA